MTMMLLLCTVAPRERFSILHSLDNGMDKG
jgi:hypothetical protein